MPTTVKAQLFAHALTPDYWVYRDDAGRYWLVPAVMNGWERRAPFYGRRRSLEPVQDFFGLGVGLPEGGTS